MRTTFFAALLLFVAVSFAEDWIEFQPPMMDDVTVDPLRFTQQGTPFDLSDPMFNPLEHGQSAKASRSGKTTKDKLAVNYEFTGREGLEYLEIRTKIKIDKPGFNIGGVFTTDLPKAGAIRVRINDPSGETHQHTLGYPKGTPIFAKIETSPDGIWGGDGDKKLQFPCEIVSILLDKPEPGFKGRGGSKSLVLPCTKRSNCAMFLKLNSPPTRRRDSSLKAMVFLNIDSRQRIS